MSDAWTISRVLQWAVGDFSSRGLDSPRLDAELLLCHSLGIDRIRLILDAQKPLSDGELSQYRGVIQRRRHGEPVAYLMGERGFYGRMFQVDKRVLIPRPDTETLVEVALKRSETVSEFARCLDLCTGSGCVGITLKKERPNWWLTASDLSQDALDVAKENALRLGAMWNARFVQGDLFQPFQANGARFELIVSNPPYIPIAEMEELATDIRDFEPNMALVAGGDGLDLIRKIVDTAPNHLVGGGVLALEHMLGQGAEIMQLFEERGFVRVAQAYDLGGRDRVVSAIWPGARRQLAFGG